MAKESPLNIIATTGNEDLAKLFVAQLLDGSLIEMVESVQPPVPRELKWVLIVSTLKGCPVSCPICDAGHSYAGRLGREDILAQIDFLVLRRYPDGHVPVQKFKIQFARMGEPAFNPAVIEVLQALPSRFVAPGLMPCLSSVAPFGSERFFEDLLDVKTTFFNRGNFQLQFSIHTSDQMRRRELIPTRTWSFEKIADYGRRFVKPGDRKIALNFATPCDFPLEPDLVRSQFDPEFFMIKLTPLNPTITVTDRKLRGLIDPNNPRAAEAIADGFRSFGFTTLVSIGELAENSIGSNCGQTARSIEKSRCSLGSTPLMANF